MASDHTLDVVIVGGGPAGLAAALTLGRARKRVLLCDAGPARNAAATHVHNFFTQDGTPPVDFRRIARRQLEHYSNVEIREARVTAIRGERGNFTVELESGTEVARRILLCTGMVDELPDYEGLRELWGHAVFACPYCHGWEIQDQRFGCLLGKEEMLPFVHLLRGWTSDVVAFTDGRVRLPPDARDRLTRAGIRLEDRRIARLRSNGDRLAAVELIDGSAIPCDALFLHPHQRQVPLVSGLGLALDSAEFVQVDPAQRETSRPGIYAAGDLMNPVQSAIAAAAAGAHAAARLNLELTTELSLS